VLLVAAHESHHASTGGAFDDGFEPLAIRLERSDALVGYGCAAAAFLKGLLDAGESAAEAYGLDGM
jgi:hypothetical protein